MTRTFAKRLGSARVPALLASLLAVLVAGCAGGLIGPLPRVGNPGAASTVTVFRDFTMPGFFAPIILEIDNRRTFRVWVNQQFSFELDPGEYLFFYTIGFNECRRLAFIQTGRSYRFRLRPNCVAFEDPP